MNRHYRQTETLSQEERKALFRPVQEGEPLEVMNKMVQEGEKQLQEEHFQDLKQSRGLKQETVERYIVKTNKEVIDTLKEEFNSETLVKSGWFKYQDQITDKEHGKTFTEWENFKQYLEEEHNRSKNLEKYKDHLYSLIPEDGYLVKYLDIENNQETVYGNIRKRNPEKGENKYWQPHQTHIEARKNYKGEIFPAMEEIGNQETLVVTEGEFKSLALKEQGFDSVAIGGVNLSQEGYQRLSQIAKEYSKVVYLVDDDLGGICSIPTMVSEMNYRDTKFYIQKTIGEDIDDQWAEDKEFDLEAKEPLQVVLDNLEFLEENKVDLESKQGYSSVLDMVFELVQGMKESEQDSKVKKAYQEINKELGKEYTHNSVLSDLKEERKQFRRKKTKQEKEQVEETEEVLQFNESIEIGNEEIYLNPVDCFYIKEHIKTPVDVKNNKSKIVKPDKKFKIYEFAFEKGTEEEKFKLFVEPDKNLNLGEKWLPLKKADFTKQVYRDWVEKEYRKATKDGYEGSFQDFLENNYEGQTFELAEPLQEESIEKLKAMSNETLKEEILEEYLRNGFDYDETLTKLNHPKIITHDKRKVDPQDVMPSNPHSAYITASKVGKSFNSERVGIVKDKVSPAGLLGFASADEENQGSLDGVTSPFYADETDEGDNKNVGDNLLAILEKGKSEHSQGGTDMFTRFYGSFNYMANPKENEDNKDQADYFLDFIQAIGNNAEAMGSRIGVLLLDSENLETNPDGSPLKKEKRDKLKMIADWIKKEASSNYTDLELQLQDWLNTSYPDSYMEQVEKRKTGIHSTKAIEFLKGHKSSSQHCRGQALRMACYERIGDLIRGEIDQYEIKELAESKFQEVMDINLRSINNLEKTLGDKEKVINRKEALLEAENNLYLKLFVKTITAKYREDQEVLKTIEPVDTFRNTFLELRNELNSIEEGDWYWKWPRVKEAVGKNINQVNKDLEDRYGLTVTEDNDTLFVKGIDFKTFRYYKDLSEESLPKLDLGEESEESEVGKSVNEQPPSPPKDTENKGESGNLQDKQGVGGGKNKETSTSQTSQTSRNNEDEQGVGGPKTGENSTSSMSNMSCNDEDSVIIKEEKPSLKDFQEKEIKQALELIQDQEEIKLGKFKGKQNGGSDIQKALREEDLVELSDHNFMLSLTSAGKQVLQSDGLKKFND